MASARARRLRRQVCSAAAALLVAAGLSAAVPSGASASPGVATAVAAAAKPAAVVRPPVVPSQVSADALPTVQVDGVVWQIAATETVAYAGGTFSTARPAGAAPGTNTVSRNNLLAFDVQTGALITGFAPNLNGAVRAVALSPNGKRLYVGGVFTVANGVARDQIAAYDTTTGTLVASFNARVNSSVNAIVATDTRVYVGGAFTVANGVGRARLAAFEAADGSLVDWHPAADQTVHALALAEPDQIIVGGAFTTIDGQPAYGMAAIDTRSGVLRPWNATQTVRNAGNTSAILSLAVKDHVVYGNGYVFGPGGNLEGAFAAWIGGGLRWVQDCHGDSYDSYPMAGALYVVSHAHMCSNVGGFPERSPRTFHHGTAFTLEPTQTLTPNFVGSYFNFGGQPAPTIVGWFPEFTIGSYTGQSQAAWAVTGTSKYLLVGGEFPTVNGVAQQGLVRFPVRSIAPNHVKPSLGGANMGVTAVSLTAGQVRVGLPADYDRDDPTLTYRLYRDGGGTPVATATAESTFYHRPWVTLTDSGLAAGTTASYRVQVADQWGNTQTSDPVSATVAGSTRTDAYSTLVGQGGAASYWRLGEPSGSTGYDWGTGGEGGGPLAYGAGVTLGTTGAVAGNTAATLNGTSTGVVTSATRNLGPQRFTVQAWVRTTTTTGGQILGFGGENYVDRSLYLTNTGQLAFVVYDGAYDAVTSPAAYNDDRWHLVTGTLDGSGMKLYVDGVLRASRTDVTSAWYQYGSWRIGGEKTSGYPGSVGTVNFRGAVDEVAIYPTALSAAQVSDLYATATGGALGAVPPDTPTTATPPSPTAPAGGPPIVSVPTDLPGVPRPEPPVVATPLG